MIDILPLLLTQALLAAVPILLASLGEILTERSGVVNIGLEGIMLLGALMGPLAVDYLHNKAGLHLPDTWWPLVAMLAAALTGALIGLLHGYISAYLAGDQIISGVAINLFAAGAVAYGIQAYWGVAGYKQVPEWAKTDPHLGRRVRLRGCRRHVVHTLQVQTRHNHQSMRRRPRIRI